MDNQNMKLSVIAYYLSKFDLAAIVTLGFKTRTEAIDTLSATVGNGNSYLKLRRDEFDVLTGSHRRGYAGRKPAHGVEALHNQLKDLSFADLSEIVLQLISPTTPELNIDAQENICEVDAHLSDVEIEAIINAQDTTSAILLRKTAQRCRVYNRNILENLKKLYQYRCQICEHSSLAYDVSIVEAHHILPFSEVQNNNSDNIMVLCPNHHRLIHNANPCFDRQRKTFVFSNGKELPLKLNLHL